MDSIICEWPYRTIAYGTIIECQKAEEAVALANLIEARICESLDQKEVATQN
jgi:hypothetical protein